ncbi:hypothetical protein EOT10_38030 [Streptomyces antnestii]|uniref:Uncharacterized protein n=1 Tax=Streptomyces antnestii TaxID=2494256 RepID=A0A3S2VM35_9ACTN|nr:hypothetical protein EOT10_38030 [Streptomyces sp. San01]
MTTTTERRAPTIGTQQRSGEEAVLRSGLEPIYTQLARQWETDGRPVPGRPDEQWTRLTCWCPWPEH